MGVEGRRERSESFTDDVSQTHPPSAHPTPADRPGPSGKGWSDILVCM